MTHLKVVHRHSDKDSERWKNIVKGFLGALLIALALSVGMVAIVESIKKFTHYEDSKDFFRVKLLDENR